MLAVEFGGEQHYAESDQDRVGTIALFGIATMRIPNSDFFMLDSAPVTDWIEQIVRRCEARSERKAER